MQTFQELLAAHRKSLGISQSELARRAEVSPSYINRLERGDREPPSREVVLAIAEGLQLDPVERDRLLLSSGYAREADRKLATEHRLYGLVTEFLQNEAVTEDEITAVASWLEVLLQRKSGEASPAGAPASGEADGHAAS
jgi:transcriptional regulator with XRE-family HTH domain